MPNTRNRIVVDNTGRHVPGLVQSNIPRKTDTIQEMYVFEGLPEGVF